MSMKDKRILEFAVIPLKSSPMIMFEVALPLMFPLAVMWPLNV